MRRIVNLREGDIFAFTYGTSSVLKKILRIDSTPDATRPLSVHCLTYEAVEEIPVHSEICALKISSLHSTLSADALVRDGTYVSNVPVFPEELVGFFEYIRENDYPRFLDERVGTVTSGSSSIPGPEQVVRKGDGDPL